jgi:hypothetical protein
MTDDLVKRLREYRIGCGVHCSHYENREPLTECIEAADRIEQLEEALQLADAALRGANMNMNVVQKKVRAALGEKKDD